MRSHHRTMALNFTASCSCGEVWWHRTIIWPFSCFGNYILKKLNTFQTYSNQETFLSKEGNMVVRVTALDNVMPYNNFVFLLAPVIPCNFVCLTCTAFCYSLQLCWVIYCTRQELPHDCAPNSLIITCSWNIFRLVSSLSVLMFTFNGKIQ